jgi:hypothetical protein
MEKFTHLEGVAAPLHILNCDTDMIIPAQWLKTIKRTGLGIADAVGQARHRIETVDGDLVAGGDLRAQAGLPQPVERPMPESDDVRPHSRRLSLTKRAPM